MNDRLTGKVIIVTGGSSGIGQSSAMLFARERAKVVIADIDEKGGKNVVQQIKAFGGEAEFIRCDVSNVRDAERVAQTAVRAFGKIDGLMNNAGINPLGTTVDTPVELWDTVLGTNLKGVFLVSKFVIPEMSKNPEGGAIVNVSSVDALLAHSNEAAYIASKGAVISLTKAMAADHARQQIRVNCICPGAISTPLITRSLEGYSAQTKQKMLRKMARMHPLGTLGKPEEVARATLFLLSDDASFITGAILNVDGGYTATKEST